MQIINLYQKIEELLSMCSETSVYIYVCVYTFLYVYLFHSKEKKNSLYLGRKRGANRLWIK